MEQPTYWSPVPEFGWAEWPAWPYLWTPQTERQKRLVRLLAIGEEPIIVELPVSATSGDYIKALENRVRKTERASQPNPFKPRSRGGRSSLEAKYHDRLRMLSVYRLRKYYRPKEVFELLKQEYRKISYNSPKHLSETLRTFERHLCAFHLCAQANMNAGRWFPPFGRHLVEP
jgi:hypothetical protein